ncbi:alpha-amylase family glycosyl hydrolase, partial [Polaribacter sp.]|nr:alpha-amylase family glycosyl hydrolase [Polaribacter sp.]
WISAHPNWYTQNEKGEIIDPINPDTGKSWGWTDVADLNHENKEMQNAMINDLKYWVENFNIDGYRMDVAHKVPPLFFNKAITELRKIKHLFMLAEAEQHELFRNGFDMQYAWEGHHILNKIAKGEANVTDFDVYMKKQEELLEASDFNMNFVTNHDENSWNGTIKERMGDASEVFTVLVYAMPGMPLIYSGQEYDLNHRLKFFEKDSIPKIKGNTWNLLEKLGSLKNNTIALNGGKNATNYERLQTENENVLTFKRGKENDAVYFIGNLSNKTQTFTIDLKGSYLDLIKQENVVFDTKKITLKPWQYYLIK